MIVSFQSVLNYATTQQDSAAMDPDPGRKQNKLPAVQKHWCTGRPPFAHFLGWRWRIKHLIFLISSKKVPSFGRNNLVPIRLTERRRSSQGRACNFVQKSSPQRERERERVLFSCLLSTQRPSETSNHSNPLEKGKIAKLGLFGCSMYKSIYSWTAVPTEPRKLSQMIFKQK